MRRGLATLFVCLLLPLRSALGDAVTLASGERYTGELRSLAHGTLTLTTPFGTLSLPWDKISALRTDVPRTVELPNGARVVGLLRLRHGVLRVRRTASGPGRVMPAAEVVGITSNVSPTSVHADVNIGATLTRGGTHTNLYHLDAQVVVRHAHDRYRASANANYSSAGKVATVNNESLSATYDHFVSRKWYVDNNIGFAHDEFTGLDLRSTAGVGVGHQFIERAGEYLSTVLGVNYVRQVYAGGVPATSEPALRWALDFHARLDRAANSPVFFHRHEILLGSGASVTRS